MAANYMKKYLLFLVLIVGNFTVNANGVDLICALDQKICDRCPEYKTILPLSKFSKNTDGFDIEADESEIIVGKYILSGDVAINSKNLFLAADNVEISSIDNSILATNNVRFQDESYLILSDHLSAAQEDEKIIATAKNAKYQDYSAGIRGANGYTDIIEKTPSSVLLTNSTYSLCPINQNDWLIDADKIELNLDENRGLANKATLKFYGVPIFYTPRYSWVLSGRGSGFLTPNFTTYNETGTNEDSFSYRVPYYFDIAPDKDLLLALNYMSSRSYLYEGKYRQLLSPDNKNSNFSIEAKYLPEDKITGLKRWLVNFSEELVMSNKAHIRATFYRVSDSKYFTEIDRTNTDLSNLNSSLKYLYSDPEQNLSLSLFSENEQLVNNGIPEYTKLLEGSASKTLNAGSRMPIKMNITSTLFDNDNSNKETGTRTHGELSISRKLKIEYPKITPSASVAVTNYSLKNSPNINRTIFGSGLDFDFTTIKNSSIFGLNAIHRLSPIISYNYKSKKAQGNIPLFDTTDKYSDVITFADLKSGERYNGADRITNNNDITLSLESSYRKVGALEDEKDLLSFKIAQTYFGNKEVVSSKENTDFESRKSYSDIVASIGLKVNNFSFNSDYQFDPDSSKIVKNENTLALNPSSRKFLSLSLSDEGSKKTEKLYGAYPITDSVHIFGGLDKTTSSGITNSEITGIAYESCCWAFRLAHFKEDNASGGYNYSTGMELVLTGLGSSSNPLRNKIESKIPGYKLKLR